jgi:hypothetical protein
MYTQYIHYTLICTYTVRALCHNWIMLALNDIEFCDYNEKSVSCIKGNF